jgi:hypothetical protein
MSNIQTLTIKTVETFPVQIKIKCPAAEGYFTGHAVARSKPEQAKILERIEDGEIEDDAAFVRELYKGFDGLGAEGEDAFKVVLEGPASSWLTPAVISAYYEQFGEARQKNARKSRRR